MSDVGQSMPRPPGLVSRALAYELAMWRSLYRWVFRRPGPAGERFGYAGVVTPVMWAFIGVSAIEIPAAHLLLPWPPVQKALLAVGVYGLLWMVGMLAALKVYPHTVDDAGLHVRHGATVHLVVPWGEIASVRRRRRSFEGIRNLHVTGSGPDRALAVAVGSQTTVDVTLRRPLPLLALRGDVEPVTQVQLFADDDRALVARLRSGAQAGLADEEESAR